MEIVLAILLLFGGFTLRSISSDNEGNESQSSMELSNAVHETDLHPVTQVIGKSDLIQCHSDGAVIYRDLTVSYTEMAGDCEVKCSDE